jgi:Ca2+-binding EF-hand superfamily protein
VRITQNKGGHVSKEKFDAIDTYGDGFITATELKASLEGTTGVSDEDIATIVQMADDNADQQISFDEYEKLLGEPRASDASAQRSR